MWKYRGIASGALLCALVIGFPAFVAMNLGDPPFDDSHLRTPPWELVPEEDGIALLAEAANELWWPEGTRLTIQELLGDGNEPTALRVELLERNRSVLSHFPSVPASRSSRSTPNPAKK